MRRLVLLVLLGVSLGAAPARADDSDSAAKRVAALRREVDELAQSLADRRRATRDELAALRAERAELSRQLRLEQVRAKTLTELEKQQQARREDASAETRAWLEPARQAVALTRAYVRASLPFQVEARLAALDQIDAQLRGSAPDVGRAMARLWRFVEEEQAMAKEIALAQQPIALDGTRRLADVARLGMALLYARTPDGRFAWAHPTDDGGWTFAAIDDPPSAALVAALFEALDANTRLGPRTLLLPPDLGDAVEATP